MLTFLSVKWTLLAFQNYIDIQKNIAYWIFFGWKSLYECSKFSQYEGSLIQWRKYQIWPSRNLGFIQEHCP